MHPVQAIVGVPAGWESGWAGRPAAANRPGVGNLRVRSSCCPVPLTACCSSLLQPGADAMTCDCRRDTEWGELLLAVIARLRSCALNTCPPPDRVVSSWPESGRLAQVSLECAQALTQLHGQAEQARGEATEALRVLNEALAAARADLRRAQLELAGTRAGAKRAQHQARHDELTQLPNRAFFNQRLAQAVASHRADGPGLAVIFLDLDGFKPINDTHGHDVGDELLGILALRLHRAVRAQDMMSRLGGDEFACLVMEGFDRAQLARLADKLFATVAAPLTLGSLVLSVRPSIGLALCPDDGHTASSLLQHADRAMYRAKRLQCRHAFYDAALDG